MKKWGQRLIGAIGAVLVGIPAVFIGVAYDDHRDGVAQFRDAQIQCKRSLALVAVELTRAADVAHEHALEEPRNDVPGSLWTSMNNAQLDCFQPPLEWSEEQRWMWPPNLVVQSAWLMRDRKYPGVETTIEEDLYRGVATSFSSLVRVVDELPEPTLRDSFEDLLPF